MKVDFITCPKRVGTKEIIKQYNQSNAWHHISIAFLTKAEMVF